MSSWAGRISGLSDVSIRAKTESDRCAYASMSSTQSLTRQRVPPAPGSVRKSSARTSASTSIVSAALPTRCWYALLCSVYLLWNNSYSCQAAGGASGARGAGQEERGAAAKAALELVAASSPSFSWKQIR